MKKLKNLNLYNMTFEDFSASNAEKFDLIIADPPYGNTNIAFNNLYSTAALNAWIELSYNLLADDGTLIYFGQQPMFSDIVNCMGSRFSHELIWEKSRASGFLNAKKMPLRAHENIAISKHKKHIYYNPTKTPRPHNKNKSVKKSVDVSPHFRTQSNLSIYTDDGTRYPRSVVFANTESNTIHPTQKPKELYLQLLLMYAKPSARILDPFLGSGNSALVASTLDCEFTGVEMNEIYFKNCLQRLQSEVGLLF